jgi:hypothetical protein
MKWEKLTNYILLGCATAQKLDSDGTGSKLDNLTVPFMVDKVDIHNFLAFPIAHFQSTTALNSSISNL